MLFIRSSKLNIINQFSIWELQTSYLVLSNLSEQNGCGNGRDLGCLSQINAIFYKQE